MYPAERIYEEAAFIAYYFHWSHDEIMNLSTLERLRWCKEISGIHDRMEDAPENPFLL